MAAKSSEKAHRFRRLALRMLYESGSTKLGNPKNKVLFQVCEVYFKLGSPCASTKAERLAILIGKLTGEEPNWSPATAPKNRRKAARAAWRQNQRSAAKFYRGGKWRRLRFKVLLANRGRCELCGATSENSVLHVDHIKPRSKYPELEYEISNLQVLCEDCNLGKSNTDETDWRKSGLRVVK